MANIRLIVFYAITLGAIIIPMLVASNKEQTDELLEQLRESNPAHKALSEKLKSINRHQKRYDYVVIGKTITVRKMLDSVKKGLTEQDCQLEEIFNELKQTKHSDLNLVLNVYNFMNRNNENSKSLCAESIKLVFGDKERLIELDKGKLEAEETKKILGNIVGKKLVMIGELSVQEIVDQESKTIFHVEDCQYNALKRRNSYFQQNTDGFVQNLYVNIRNFDKTSFKRLVLFCAENIEEVYNTCYTKNHDVELQSLSSAEPLWTYQDDTGGLINQAKVDFCHYLRIELIGNVEHIEDLSGTKMPENLREKVDSMKTKMEALCRNYFEPPDSGKESGHKTYLDEEINMKMSELNVGMSP